MSTRREAEVNKTIATTKKMMEVLSEIGDNPNAQLAVLMGLAVSLSVKVGVPLDDMISGYRTIYEMALERISIEQSDEITEIKPVPFMNKDIN